ncbi:MAG: L-alanine-DL-glutamate epimerase [Opitutaceae bacterium]
MDKILSPESPPVDPASPNAIRIRRVEFDFKREPFRKPLGFKGGHCTEKWINQISLTSESGSRATSSGGQAVLWADERVFLSRTEAGANTLMATVAEFALQRARRESFRSPLELHDSIVDDVHAFACGLTGLPDLSPTFTLNAMVALDNAAWLLHAREHGIASFDELIPAEFRPALSERHDLVACIPLLSYTTPAEEIIETVERGHFFLKIKIGAPGNAREMLAADKKRIREINRLVGDRETPHTADGRIRFYLDANGRYQSRNQVEELLEVADRDGFLAQIALFEEPFNERTEAGIIGLPVVFAADESLHHAADVAARRHAGFGAVALKPAGKGLTTTLRLAREARRLGASLFVADSACTPELLDWNKNVAARLPALDGIKIGLIEVNGWQSYDHWEQMLDAHPACGEPSFRAADGVFRLDDEFYATGGLFKP